MKYKNFTPLPLASIFLILTIFISSCSTISISQRRYNKGFNIEFGKNTGKNLNNKKVAKSNSGQNDDITIAEIKYKGVNDILNESNIIMLNTDVSESFNQEETTSSSSISTEFISKDKNGEFFEKNITSDNTNQKKEVKKAIKEFKSNHKSSKEIQVSERMLLLTILAFLLPPLAVYLYEGSWTINCTLNLILTIIFWVPGIIHALLIIYGYI